MVLTSASDRLPSFAVTTTVSVGLPYRPARSSIDAACLESPTSWSCAGVVLTPTAATAVIPPARTRIDRASTSQRCRMHHHDTAERGASGRYEVAAPLPPAEGAGRPGDVMMSMAHQGGRGQWLPASGLDPEPTLVRP